VYAQVKSRIVLGQARPGDVIAAHALAKEFAVSRSPVHEALKRLVGDGFLVAQPRVGYTVTPINLDEMHDLFQVRVRLEALAAELAAINWTEEHRLAFMSANKAAQTQHRILLRQGSALDRAQFSHEQHRQFHLMIADLGGNRRLARLIGELQDETQRYWSLLPDEPSTRGVFLGDEGHRAILDAIASRDAGAARHSIVQHMQEGVRAMLEGVVPKQPPVDDLGA
jgi:DNA-binding GntR family transcriptional regulator